MTKYHGSVNNPLRANGDFRQQIFAGDCNSSGETEEVQDILQICFESVSFLKFAPQTASSFVEALCVCILHGMPLEIRELLQASAGLT